MNPPRPSSTPLPPCPGTATVCFAAFLILAPANLPAQDFQLSTIERLAFEEKNPAAPGVLSLYLRYGFGTPQNFFAAAEVIPVEAAAHPYATYNMGVLLLNRASAVEEEGVAARMRQHADRFFAMAVPGLTELAGQGDPVAQLLLGGCYETGRGVPRDDNQARSLYLASASTGFPLALSNLADMLIKGNGGPQNVEDGLKLMEKAAEAGVPMAMYSLAQAYLTGQGRRKSVSQGISLLKQAADQHNHQVSQTDLARFYLDGVHVTKNEEQGMEYLIRAVANNSAEAIRRARRMGYTVDVSEVFPDSFAAALSGRAPHVELRPLFHGMPSPSTAQNLPGNAPGTRAAPVPTPTPKQLPPGFTDFQEKFADKARQAFQEMDKAILAAVNQGDFSAPAVFAKLAPASGKASDWLESTFAAENLLLGENPDWSALLLPDKTFAYSVLDLPAQSFPLIETNRHSEALRLVRHWDEKAENLSPAMRQAWLAGFNQWETFLSKKIFASEEVREQSRQASAEGRIEQALELWQQAMKLDLQPEDSAQVEELQKKIKEEAFQNIGL